MIQDNIKKNLCFIIDNFVNNALIIEKNHVDSLYKLHVVDYYLSILNFIYTYLEYIKSSEIGNIFSFHGYMLNNKLLFFNYDASSIVNKPFVNADYNIASTMYSLVTSFLNRNYEEIKMSAFKYFFYSHLCYACILDDMYNAYFLNFDTDKSLFQQNMPITLRCIEEGDFKITDYLLKISNLSSLDELYNSIMNGRFRIDPFNYYVYDVVINSQKSRDVAKRYANRFMDLTSRMYSSFDDLPDGVVYRYLNKLKSFLFGKHDTGNYKYYLQQFYELEKWFIFEI